jgi:DNA-binding beta-propeller fold protein YncE
MPRRALAALITVAVLSGCSLRGPLAGSHGMDIARPSGSAVAPGRSPALAETAGAPLLYVSNVESNNIEIYKQAGTNQSPIATLSGSSFGGPVGLFVARNEDLYVANVQSSDVIVFKKGASTPYLTLLDPGEDPYDVVVDRNGTVYVTNLQTTTGGVGSVSVYAGGSTTPTSVLAVPNNESVRFCTLDRNHNLFVGFQNSKTRTGAVMEFFKGVGPGVPTELKVSLPGGMQFDTTQDLVVANEHPESILVFEPPLKTPSQTIPTGGFDLMGLAFTNSGNDVYVAEFGSAAVLEFAYPSGALVDTITKGVQNGFAQGVATDPPQPF